MGMNVGTHGPTLLLPTKESFNQNDWIEKLVRHHVTVYTDATYSILGVHEPAARWIHIDIHIENHPPLTPECHRTHQTLHLTSILGLVTVMRRAFMDQALASHSWAALRTRPHTHVIR